MRAARLAATRGHLKNLVKTKKTKRWSGLATPGPTPEAPSPQLDPQCRTLSRQGARAARLAAPRKPPAFETSTWESREVPIGDSVDVGT